MLRLAWMRQPFELMLQGSYFLEDIHQTFEQEPYGYVDNKNIRVLSEGSIAFGKYITAAFQLEYHLRLYTDENHITENITFAGTLSGYW